MAPTTNVIQYTNQTSKETKLLSHLWYFAGFMCFGAILSAYCTTWVNQWTLNSTICQVLPVREQHFSTKEQHLSLWEQEISVKEQQVATREQNISCDGTKPQTLTN